MMFSPNHCLCWLKHSKSSSKRIQNFQIFYGLVFEVQFFSFGSLNLRLCSFYCLSLPLNHLSGKRLSISAALDLRKMNFYEYWVYRGKMPKYSVFWNLVVNLMKSGSITFIIISQIVNHQSKTLSFLKRVLFFPYHKRDIIGFSLLWSHSS